MQIKEVFDQLRFAELSQLSIGGNDPGVIDGTNFERILVHLNTGLTALYKRFYLKEEREFIILVPGTREYTLTGPVLKIEQVLTDGMANEGEKLSLPLNDGMELHSVFTPSAKVLRVPEDLAAGVGENLPEKLRTGMLEVVYRADHPRINHDLGHFDVETIEVALPDSHLLALCYFIASRVHNPIGMSEEFHAGNSYAAKYELECQQLEAQGMRIDRDNSVDRLTRGGWV